MSLINNENGEVNENNDKLKEDKNVNEHNEDPFFHPILKKKGISKILIWTKYMILFLN